MIAAAKHAMDRGRGETVIDSIPAQAVPPPIGQSEIRYEQLDGLRGMAAFVVFLFHAIMICPPDSRFLRIMTIPVIRPFWDGPGAVMLFFVLSGFVLTLPYTAAAPRKIEFVPFLIRRIARLYPAYWAVLAVALALRTTVFNPHGLSALSPWINMHWSRPLGWTSVLNHAFMISPRIQVDDLDPVIWSLIIEMKISIIFPFLLLLVKRTTGIAYACAVVVLAITLTTPLHFVTHSSSSWSRAAIMLPAFMAGAYLARYRRELVSGLRRSRQARIGVAIAGAFLYSLVWMMPSAYQSLARLGSAFGSGAFILLFLASARLESIGTAAPIRFLGRVSYSFYLVHLPILITAASLLFTRVHSLAIVIALSLLVSSLVAWALSTWVEAPAHNWGKRLASYASIAARQRAAESVAS